jgi:hypothetical protein
VQLPPLSCYFISLWSKYTRQNPVLKHPHSIYLSLMRVTKFHTRTKQLTELWPFYFNLILILTVIFLGSRREDKRLWIEG